MRSGEITELVDALRAEESGAAAVRIEKVNNEYDAGRVVDFFFSGRSFDDTRFTPGEEEQLRRLPYEAASGQGICWYAEDDAGIAGVLSVAENEQRTGGYSWDYIAVRRECRKQGIAALLIDAMLYELRLIGARYLVTYTCSLPEYAGIQRLFVRKGFALVGRLPDYYFEGEDRLIYAMRLRD